MLTDTIKHNLHYLHNKAPGETFTALDAISFYKYLIDNQGDPDQLFIEWYNTRRYEAAN